MPGREPRTDPRHPPSSGPSAAFGQLTVHAATVGVRAPRSAQLHVRRRRRRPHRPHERRVVVVRARLRPPNRNTAVHLLGDPQRGQARRRAGPARGQTPRRARRCARGCRLRGRHVPHLVLADRGAALVVQPLRSHRADGRREGARDRVDLRHRASDRDRIRAPRRDASSSPAAIPSAARGSRRRDHGAGGHAAFIAADLGDEARVHRLVDAPRPKLGGLTVLVNNAAGGGRRDGRVGDLTTDAWEAILRVDLTAPMWCARAAIPHLRARRCTARSSTSRPARPSARARARRVHRGQGRAERR